MTELGCKRDHHSAKLDVRLKLKAWQQNKSENTNLRISPDGSLLKISLSIKSGQGAETFRASVNVPYRMCFTARDMKWCVRRSYARRAQWSSLNSHSLTKRGAPTYGNPSRKHIDLRELKRQIFYE